MNIIHQLHHIILTIKKVAKDFFSFLFERERERERERFFGATVQNTLLAWKFDTALV